MARNLPQGLTVWLYKIWHGLIGCILASFIHCYDRYTYVSITCHTLYSSATSPSYHLHHLLRYIIIFVIMIHILDFRFSISSLLSKVHQFDIDITFNSNDVKSKSLEMIITYDFIKRLWLKNVLFLFDSTYLKVIGSRSVCYKWEYFIKYNTYLTHTMTYNVSRTQLHLRILYI